MITSIMSTIQQNGFSPISTNNSTITNNHFLLFDNSDQGSVDSDYTSLGSSKFYGNGGSTSSLHRQGRSQSIDELATSTTNIPTRHFNGILNVNKLNNDPLQFVKIQPNHELIERAQEQLNLLESRKRLQDNLKFNPMTNSTSNAIKHHNVGDDTDWSQVNIQIFFVFFCFKPIRIYKNFINLSKYLVLIYTRSRPFKREKKKA